MAITVHPGRSVAGRRDDSGTQLRDSLTIDRLTAAVADLPEVTVEAYDAQWWDGQAHDPCLLIRFGDSRARRRVVETGGDALVLPVGRRRASRALAARRAVRRPDLGVPAPRAARDDVVVDASADAVRCTGSSCGVMRSVDATGPCPVCGLS